MVAIVFVWVVVSTNGLCFRERVFRDGVLFVRKVYCYGFREWVLVRVFCFCGPGGAWSSLVRYSACAVGAVSCRLGRRREM